MTVTDHVKTLAGLMLGLFIVGLLLIVLAGTFLTNPQSKSTTSSIITGLDRAAAWCTILLTTQILSSNEAWEDGPGIAIADTILSAFSVATLSQQLVGLAAQ